MNKLIPIHCFNAVGWMMPGHLVCRKLCTSTEAHLPATYAWTISLNPCNSGKICCLNRN